MKEFIESGKAVMGIEFGSTRIKAVLIDEKYRVVAQGAHDWENQLVDGVWSYSLEAIEAGVRDAYAKCAADVEAKYGVKLTKLAALGISGMMHGYLPFDAAGKLLTPFRTWRNVMTAQAAAELSELFTFNVPQRWSVAHYTQAILNKESHIPAVRWLTTLAGYVHYRLTGENVMGVGEASGMKAGVLTDRGAAWLDPTGTLQAGAVMAPPEGDAGTGMVATNAVAPKTGNVSAGTSIFAMLVLENAMKGYYPEIDVVTTPTGHEVAMVHCNNCTNEINAWMPLFGNDYRRFFQASLQGAPDCGGVVVVPFLSGEPVAGVADAMLRVVRKPGANFTFENFARAQVYSAFVSLKLGMDILSREGVTVDSLMGHGGIFKDKGIAQQYLADALKTSVTCRATATEGGPWGMAVLAAFAARNEECKMKNVNCVELEAFLAKEVFAGAASETLAPTEEGMAGFDRYAANFKEAIHA